MIKRESRPAYHLMFAHAVCVLALTGLTLMFTPVVDANDDVWCQLMFESLWFQEVPPSIQLECGEVFQENIDAILSAHPLNSNK